MNDSLRELQNLTTRLCQQLNNDVDVVDVLQKGIKDILDSSLKETVVSRKELHTTVETLRNIRAELAALRQELAAVRLELTESRNQLKTAQEEITALRKGINK
jgi:uncharacterized coiled-coil DUF342 family protein